MNFNAEKKPLVEAALISAMASVFVLVSLYIPILAILIFILPVAFIMLGIRYPIKYAIFSLVFVCLITVFFTDILYTLFLIIMFGPVSLTMAYLMKNKRKEFEVIVISTTVSTISWFILIQAASVISGVDIVNQVADLFRESFLSQTDMLNQIQVSELRVNQSINFIIGIIPALVVIQSMIISVINYYLSITILRRTIKYKENIPSFSSFKLPNHIVMGFLFLVVLAFLTQYVEGIYYETLLNNITTIFLFLLFLQGTSVIVFFIEKTKLSKIFRTIIVIVIILTGALITFIALAGFIDTIFNIRKLNKDQ